MRKALAARSLHLSQRERSTRAARRVRGCDFRKYAPSPQPSPHRGEGAHRACGSADVADDPSCAAGRGAACVAVRARAGRIREAEPRGRPRPRQRSMRCCSARSRGCSATSPNGTGSRSQVCGVAVRLFDLQWPVRHLPGGIFVRPALRGKGIGKALMAHLARQCTARGAAHLQWSVLDWNTPSINFYKSLGAVLKDEWTICPSAVRRSHGWRRRSDGHRHHRGGRGKWRDRARRHDAVAAEIRHAAFPCRPHRWASRW